MGITGELVRNVFSKSRSIQRHDHSHGKSNGVERKKWSNSVRSYLCGDEYNSVLAAEDSASVRSSTIDLASVRSTRATNVSSNAEDFSSAYDQEVETASVRSSEATVNQPLLHAGNPIDETRKEKQNSTYKLFQQEDAALIIQTAFRGFLARRARDGAKTEEVITSPSRESIGTSIEVQTGNSQSDIFSIKEESVDVPRTMRNRARAQVLKLQEDWDDSTVSSVISKMRIQNKLEAATRRERALAYAFSQQLRICSKKRQSTGNGDEMNAGWSWLERWMAAREPEIRTMEDEKTSVVRKRIMLDAAASAMEEKESCGSNEVSSLLELNNSLSFPKNVPRPSSKVITSNLSRQNSASTNFCPREESKDIKKVCDLEDDEKDKRKKAKYKQQAAAGNKRD
ncbi:hypothetical protein BUALT_Bualt13G0069100 [Buddleja alternifolia]|uniref:Uncharacterized protein n=1 Tax=Buddleja alternifolia TaxID=168488 RepID=A0AAV6WW78_9LAMI|nr:hypothetical protein BUALT_Bualt13G0069100 [Buddleja alternifolia]